MENIIAQNHLIEAEHAYKRAMDEYSKPQRDQVEEALIEMMHSAIMKYLMAYIEEEGITVPEQRDLESLQKKCVQLNTAFERLNFSGLSLLHHDDAVHFTHILSTERIKRYMDTLKQVKNLVAGY